MSKYIPEDDKKFNELPLEDKLKILNINTLKEYNKYDGQKIGPNYLYQYFYEEEYDKVNLIFNPPLKPTMYKKSPGNNVVKKIKKPLYEIEVEDIVSDYKHFEIDFTYSNSLLRFNLKLNYEKMSINNLFKSIREPGNCYIRPIVLTEQLIDSITENSKIIDLKKYEVILFINIIQSLLDDFSDEEGEIKINLIRKYYDNIYYPYFSQKYLTKNILKKETTNNSEIKIPSMKMKTLHFDIVYESCYPESEFGKNYKHKCDLKRKFFNSEEMTTYKSGIRIGEPKVDYQLVMFNRLFNLEMRQL